MLETPLPAKTQGRTSDCLLTSFHRVPLQGGFKKLARCIPEEARAGASLCHRLRKVRGDFGSHGSKPRGGLIQPGCWHKAGTHWQSVGDSTGGRTSCVAETARTRATGGRTGNIAGMLERRLPVDVPAALCECWGQSPDSRAGTQRKGDQPKDWRATGPVVREAVTISASSASVGLTAGHIVVLQGPAVAQCFEVTSCALLGVVLPRTVRTLVAFVPRPTREQSPSGCTVTA